MIRRKHNTTVRRFNTLLFDVFSIWSIWNIYGIWNIHLDIARVDVKDRGIVLNRAERFDRVEKRGGRTRDYLHAAPCARTWKQRLTLCRRTTPTLRFVFLPLVSRHAGPSSFPYRRHGPYIDPRSQWRHLVSCPTFTNLADRRPNQDCIPEALQWPHFFRFVLLSRDGSMIRQFLFERFLS